MLLFRRHVDACAHCRDHPFALCLEGLRLLTAAAAVHVVGCTCDDCAERARLEREGA